jgi:plastocyanin
MNRMISLGLFCLLAVGCATNPGGGSGNGNVNGNTAGTTVEVSIDNSAFTPASVTVHVGYTVRWTNHQVGVPHTVTSGNPGDADAGALFDSGAIEPGQSFSLTFTEQGTFRYFCDFHEEIMRDATVTVEP